MTEDEARNWLFERHGAPARDAIGRFLDMVIAETSLQNLIAPSTVQTIWLRHAVDSAQLLAFDRPDATWLDIGTGGGFPGMVVALLRSAPVIMVEPRKRRSAFLERCVEQLGLVHAQVVPNAVERWSGYADVVSARAVASLDALFTSARHCTGTDTRWILPKGRSARSEVDRVQVRWDGVFHVKQSIADRDAGIVIAEGVDRR